VTRRWQVALLLGAGVLTIEVLAQLSGRGLFAPLTAGLRDTPAAPPVCILDTVVDGDTAMGTCDGRAANLRLTGFDTPETFEPGCEAERALGEAAKTHLARLLQQATLVEVEITGEDHYNRMLAVVRLDGVPLSETMIAADLAVAYAGGTRINWCQRLQ